ncbi:MAG: hypothetical protein EH225_08265 [Calditrichaeota bacterium]|nr:hypothetical protein [Calditrichota bacterium]RQV92869.1 MAG: hypothetical protein EH221_10685 [bacterium]RQW02620.1 MAG: hypothetical protein EH225_08265 [Calditrichota bacterium]
MILKRSAELLIFLLILCGDPAAYCQSRENYTAADSLGIAEITAEEIQSYRADFFPLSLAEKGRQSVYSWRGMPPGFLDTYFEDIRLNNPLWGYWDNQHIPIEIIRKSPVEKFTGIYRLYPVPVSETADPVTRIAYSQDFQFGLSYLDANHVQFYRPKSYFRLGGGNFVRDGSAGPFSRIQMVNYRVQFHHQISEKVSADIWYWQIRHKFALAPFPVITEDQRFHRIGQVMWFKLTYEPDSTGHLEFMPYGYKWGDRFQQNNFAIQRKTELYSAGIKTAYLKKLRTVKYGMEADAIRHKITSAFMFRTNEQWDGRFSGFIELGNRNLSLRIHGGIWHTADIGTSPEAGLQLGWKIWRNVENVFSIFRNAQSLPLAPRAWTGYSISPLTEAQLPLRQGVSWSLKLPHLPGINLELEPYYYKFLEAWYYTPKDSAFVQKDFDNSGIFVRAGMNPGFFELENEFSYNREKSFSPEMNNVVKLMFPITLFNGNLKLENYGVYHYIRKWYRLDYDPFINQYTRTNQLTGPFHLLDIKILAHIKTATIFLVWDNLLSEDYVVVDSYYDLYRGFRFGIYWTLFN